MKNICAILVFGLFVSGCASLHQQAHYYFTNQTQYASVESVNDMQERLSRYHAERRISGQDRKEREMIECLLLRNQLFVASLKGASKEVKNAAKLLEEGFQADDKTFIDVCFQVRNTDVGHVFMKVQHENVKVR